MVQGKAAIAFACWFLNLCHLVKIGVTFEVDEGGVSIDIEKKRKKDGFEQCSLMYIPKEDFPLERYKQRIAKLWSETRSNQRAFAEFFMYVLRTYPEELESILRFFEASIDGQKIHFKSSNKTIQL